MSVSVTRSDSCLIKPSDETPSATLDLSPIDKVPVLRCNARTLHVFKHGGQEASRVIRDALAKALVPYYPLAGRLKESVPGRLEIECTSEGVRFIEATADCTLRAVNYFDDVTTIPYDELLPDPLDPSFENNEPLVQMQVTQFACGGFVIGLVFCHTVCDGLGAAQFLLAVSEFGRGLPKPTVQPVWHRDFFPSQKIPLNHPAIPPTLPPFPNCQLQNSNIDILIDRINLLKQSYHRKTGRYCSTFEAVAAFFWKSRTEAISSNNDVGCDPQPFTQTLVFFANCRHLTSPPLPEGFYGNCFFPLAVRASAESLRQSPLQEVVDMIRGAKRKLATEFERYMNGESVEDPFAPPLGYSTLFLSEWGRLGFNDVDYGWGAPVHVVPIQGSAVIPAGIVGWSPPPRKGVRLMTWCVEEGHRERLFQLMERYEDV